MTQVLHMNDVALLRNSEAVLSGVSWTINTGERWAVLGPNGAGKTTLLNIAAARMHQTSGEVSILGELLGEADVQELRTRVGLSSSALADQISPAEKVHDVVMTAAHGVTGRAREEYGVEDESRATHLLAAFGMLGFAERQFGTLSEGEAKRVQIARALMADPELLLLDEPAAGLDLAGREELMGALTELAGDSRSPVLVMVTHHVEEIPVGFTHAALVKQGTIVSSGLIEEVLTSERVSDVYGMPVEVVGEGGRWTARGRRD